MVDSYAMLVVIVLAALLCGLLSVVQLWMIDMRRRYFVLLALIVLISCRYYILYTIIISILVAMFALAIGFIGAYLLDKQFAPQLTAQAQYSFGSINSNKVIRLIAVDYATDNLYCKYVYFHWIV